MNPTVEEISLCKKCYCMTKTIDSKCGKCGEIKYPTVEKKKAKCEIMTHDFKHLKRFGKADWRCPKCGENVMLLLVYAYQAGIDLTK